MELPIKNVNKFDTPSTIRNKIGIQYNIDPKYLNNFKISQGNVLVGKIITILEFLRDFEEDELDKNKTPSLKKFYEKVHQNFNLTPQDILNVWLNHSSIYKEARDSDNDTLFNFLNSELNNDLNELKMMYPNEFVGVSTGLVPKRLDMRPTSSTTRDIAEFDASVKEFDSIKPVDVSHFEQKKQYITITIDLKGINYPLDYFYDKIKLDDTIPFASYNEYCKLLKTFVLNGNVGVYDDTILLLYKKAKIEFGDDDDVDDEEDDDHGDDDYEKNNTVMWYKLYSTILIKKVTDEESNFLTIEMDIENNVNIDSILKNIEQVLNWPEISIKSDIITTNKISGEFYVIKQIIDPIVTKDVILFNPVLKRIMYSNDNLLSLNYEIQKNKNPYRNIIHYVEYTTKTKFVCNITTRMSTRGDVVSNPSLKLGEPMTVFKIIRGAGIDVITRFQDIVAKFITIYNNHSKKITDEYSRYVKGVNTRTFTIKDGTLSDIAPHVFVDKYSRLCSKQKNPIITEEEYKEDDDSALVFPKDDPEARVYKCTDSEYKYSGLVVNNLGNKSEYPFLPCCFKTNQKTNPTSNYSKYYSNEEDDEQAGAKKSEYERVLQTQKFANFGSFGILPDDVTKLLKIFDKSYDYYRRGMHYRNPTLVQSSFLECVLDALNFNEITKQKDEKERETIINVERDAIANFIRGSGLCKQECYNLSVEDIENNIRNPNYYLSPALYIRALEEHYSVNIFIFQRNASMPSGNLVIPNHHMKHGYIFTPLKSRLSVLIYEHTGGIWDTQYSCELVIRYNPTTLKTATVFNPDDKLIVNLYKQMLQMYSIYQVNTVVSPVQILDLKNVKAQFIDIYGKTRYLEYKVPPAIVYCQPLPPLNVPVLATTPTVKNVQAFIDKYSLKEIRKGVYSVDGYFEVIKGAVEQGDTSLSLAHLSSFVYNKRVSIHLIEYLLYLYSVYIKDKKVVKNTATSVKEFLSVYTTVTKKPVTYSINFLAGNNSKVIELESEEMRNKLNYVMRVNLLNNRKKILEYHNQNYLDNYYNSIFDFTEYPHQYLFYLNSINVMTKNMYDTQLYLQPPLTKYNSSVFFIRYIDKNYLSQVDMTLDNALTRLYNWYQNDINSLTSLNYKDFKFLCVPYTQGQYGSAITVEGPTIDNGVVPVVIYVYNETGAYFIPLMDFEKN